MPSSTKDDRGIVDRWTSPGPGGPRREGDIHLPSKPSRKDPRLITPLEGLKRAVEGYKAAKKAGLF